MPFCPPSAPFARPVALALTLGLTLGAFASTASAKEKEPRRVRIAIGPEIQPSFPGADSLSVRPFLEGDIARGDEPFEFEAPDESFGIPVVSVGGFEVGPSMAVEGKRKADEVPGFVKVNRSLELGGFVQMFLAPSFRLRADLRQGVTGHEALVGSVSADWIMRDGDRWLVSVGPRVTLGSGKHQRTWFGVSPAQAAASGLPVFEAKGGVQSVGAAAGLIRQLDARWSLHGYARYDRLVGDAADSPVVRAYGARDQFSGGLALGYTFWWGKR
ncbi:MULTISPECIES: MipA/OmpV family protein [unclassified Sphingobium]|uniref:MipA/OmpV family protein n=1 Tax=unclassified Sphingobium TaxID=2611147 RepID=UPI0022254893|nr:MULTISPECIES: MipA/OmpV family protein [unclassified Sphingobium]MCW2382676.1 outer membrane protein [Sphingobium sp. B2D3B]MCW2397151.1 outer membrane protein [Sphingobium sp. B2D3C]